jgi:hypothetical protein
MSKAMTKRHKKRLTALTVSAIFDIHMNTASLLLQNAETVVLSTSLSLAVVFRIPMSNNLARS